MKVWVLSIKKLPPLIATVYEPKEEHWKGREQVRVVGTGDSVLVDREDLRNVLEHHGSSGSRSNWCNWPDCGWSGEVTEHTCPLREEV